MQDASIGGAMETLRDNYHSQAGMSDRRLSGEVDGTRTTPGFSPPGESNAEDSSSFARGKEHKGTSNQSFLRLSLSKISAGKHVSTQTGLEASREILVDDPLQQQISLQNMFDAIKVEREREKICVTLIEGACCCLDSRGLRIHRQSRRRRRLGRHRSETILQCKSTLPRSTD